MKDKYDYLLIDCMPSLGMLTINSLASSNSVIVPVQSQYFAAKGRGYLLQTIGKVKRQINSSISLEINENTNIGKLIQEVETVMKQLIEDNMTIAEYRLYTQRLEM